MYPIHEIRIPSNCDREWSSVFVAYEGYAITNLIRRQSDNALTVEEGTLYLALLRLENKGLLEAERELSENNRKAKLCRLTAGGNVSCVTSSKPGTRYATGLVKALGVTQPPLPEEIR